MSGQKQAKLLNGGNLPANSEWAGECGAGNARARSVHARVRPPTTYGRTALLQKRVTVIARIFYSQGHLVIFILLWIVRLQY